MEDVQVAVTPVPVSSLRRRNSVRTSLLITSNSSSSSSSSSSNQSFPSDDYELISIKPSSYTSLRDLLPSPAAVQSPNTTSAPVAGGHSGYEISIRNRLVKQAAWAYLQPMSTSTESHGPNFIHRALTRLSALSRFIIRTFDWMFRSIFPVKS